MFKVLWYVLDKEVKRRGPFESLKGLYQAIDTSEKYTIFPSVYELPKQEESEAYLN